MKTNQIMIREAGFVQRTSDFYFNAGELLNLYNEKSGEKKQLSNFLTNQSTKDFIEQLKLEHIEKPYIAMRGGNVKDKDRDSGKWMHPKLFIDFAMWLSVEFKSKVIDMVIDKLIQSRTDAGDYHKEMCASIMSTYIDIYGTKPPAMLFINESRMIKQIANLDIDRNEMSEKDLSRITILQKVNSTLIGKNIGKASRIKHLKIVNESLL
jgi:elongation factor P--beta-lysine ligase